MLVFVEGGVLKAAGFLLTQSLDQLEALDLSEFKVFQVALSEIGRVAAFGSRTSARPVVRRFAGDDDVVGMALAQAGGGDAHEPVSRFSEGMSAAPT